MNEVVKLIVRLYLPIFLILPIVAASCAKKELLFKTVENQPQAFSYLPRTEDGFIDWVAALNSGIIKPRDAIDPKAPPKSPPLNLDILFDSKTMPAVVYPHYQHTQWLDCTNCHPKIFKAQRGGNGITMEKIFAGEFCGRCHGTVAFPLEYCDRCHVRPK
jgi:c(7)-type cytochrome triheme protein